MKECHKCGTINSDGAYNCSSCLSTLPKTVSGSVSHNTYVQKKSKICPSCSELNDENRITCFNCLSTLKPSVEYAQKIKK